MPTSYILAQKTGKPFVQNFSPSMYRADVQNWAIVQDQQGLLYFANDQGVLEYDGKNWRLIPTDNNSAVRSLTLGPNNVIYVGGSGEFGYLSPDSMGTTRYTSLKNKLSKKHQDFE
ncbi:MAG: histidine kinase, partial [Bacteroidia bacterium]|nr:histidine kinase [Bacteroidia bacterium]